MTACTTHLPYKSDWNANKWKQTVQSVAGGRWSNWNLIHCWWGPKMKELLLRNSLAASNKVRHPAPRYLPKRKEKCPQKSVCMNVCGSCVHSCKNKTQQASFKWWMDKQTGPSIYWKRQQYKETNHGHTTAWMNLKCLLLGEGSQTLKATWKGTAHY